MSGIAALMPAKHIRLGDGSLKLELGDMDIAAIDQNARQYAGMTIRFRSPARALCPRQSKKRSDPACVRAYNELAEEFALAEAIIRARTEAA